MGENQTSSDRELHEQIWRAMAPLLNVWFNDLKASGRAEAIEVEHLLDKRDNEPGMEVVLLQGMRDHSPTQARRGEMVKGLVRSILHPDGFQPMTHAKSARSEDVDPKTRQRFYNELYPNIFPVLSTPRRERQTRRTSIVSPPFAAQSPRLRAMGEDALRHFSIHGTIDEPLPHDVRWHTRLTHHVVLKDLCQFQKEALTALENARVEDGSSTALARELKWNLQRVSDILVMMHANVTGILAAQWFMARRPETRMDILHARHGVTVTREDVDAAFALLRELYSDEEAAGAVFERAALPFVRQGSWSYAFLLLERVYISAVPSEHVRGGIIGNIGALLRRGGHIEEALWCLERSVGHHAKAGDRFELFIAIRDLAETLWPTRESEAREWLVAALQLAQRLPTNERYEAIYNVETMFTRLALPAYATWASEVKDRIATGVPLEVPFL